MFYVIICEINNELELVMGAVTFKISGFDLPIDYKDIPEVSEEAKKSFSQTAGIEFPAVTYSNLQAKSLRGAVQEFAELGPVLSSFAETAYTVAEIAGLVFVSVGVVFLALQTFVVPAVGVTILGAVLLGFGIYEISTNEKRKSVQGDVEKLFQATMKYVERHVDTLRSKVDAEYIEVKATQKRLESLDSDWRRYLLEPNTQRILAEKELVEGLSGYFTVIKGRIDSSDIH
jgi:hypothetical protein